MELYKRKGSKYWLVDFVANGQRFRQSTRATTKTRAMEVAAELIRKASEPRDEREDTKPKGPPPLLGKFGEEKFLPYVEGSQLDPDTKRYYKNGWRLLKESAVAKLRVDRITTADGEVLQVPGSGSNANCALRTLRRMLSLAKEKSLIGSV